MFKCFHFYKMKHINILSNRITGNSRIGHDTIGTIGATEPSIYFAVTPSCLDSSTNPVFIYTYVIIVYVY